MTKRLWSCAGAALLLCSTAGAAAPPRSSAPAPVPPPFQGAYQPQGVDEIGLWRDDDEYERALAASPLVIRDEKLNAYLRDVLCRTVGDDRCQAARIYVLREPTFNATMSPNGTMRVYSGLLLRVRNEAELASVLGHEFGHFEKRHGLAGYKRARTGSDILAWGQLLVSMASSFSVQSAMSSVELAVYGTFFRYGREQEREADLLGIGYLNHSAMRPQAASQVWQNLMGEFEASASHRGLKKPKFDAIAFTASHPPEAERAGYLAALAAPDAAARDDGAERYRTALASWQPVFLDDQVKLNDFGATEYIITGLAKQRWTPGLWFARGELYRTRGHPRDFVHAVEFYNNAIQLDASHAAAHRGLGLALIKSGRRSEGQAALQRYLELHPQADDAKMIRMMIPQGENL